MKLRGGTSKWILRRFAEKLLPRDVVTRSKQGFALPVGQWLASGALGSPDTVQGDRADFWRSRLEQQRQQRSDHRLYLWSEIALRNSAIASRAPTTQPNPETIAA
jgi:asparagine synthase (glutamine-hydrolysing)